MTEEWKKIIIRYHYIVVCILMGLLVLGGVFVGSIQTDLNTAEKHFSDTISYIKEQCTGYDNLNLASETKSLMRVMENVQHLCSDIERERELDDAAVAQYLRSYTITVRCCSRRRAKWSAALRRMTHSRRTSCRRRFPARRC